MSLHTFTIDEATISIYPTDASGQPITDTPVWLGACANGINIKEQLEEVEDRASGIPNPEVFHLAEQHEIEIERLWEMKVPMSPPPDPIQLVNNPELFQNGQDYKLRHNMKYVMQIVWEDADDPNRHHWRVYYGVTDRSNEVRGTTAEGKTSSLHFRAEYYLT